MTAKRIIVSVFVLFTSLWCTTAYGQWGVPAGAVLDPAIYGKWDAPFDSQIVAIHVNILPNGKVLYWDHDEEIDDGGIGGFRLWDSATGTINPTNTTLANGDGLVTSGSISSNNVNKLPQEWQTATHTWRNLTNANSDDGGSSLYPWMFVGPDGRVFKAGPEWRSRFLDTAGLGVWTLMLCRVTPQGEPVIEKPRTTFD